MTNRFLLILKFNLHPVLNGTFRFRSHFFNSSDVHVQPPYKNTLLLLKLNVGYFYFAFLQFPLSLFTTSFLPSVLPLITPFQSLFISFINTDEGMVRNVKFLRSLFVLREPGKVTTELN